MTNESKPLRVVVVGPVYPYKGGIAHYTSLLAKEFTKSHDVKVISFSLQYPKMLYPGDQQKDYENETFKIDGTDYLINSINPFTWVNAALAIARFTPNIVILPWWNPFFGPCFFMISLLTKLLTRSKILFLIHNVLPHERLPFDTFITKCTLGTGDFYIIQSSENEDKLCNILTNAVYKKAFHPTYDAFNSENVSINSARQHLSLSSDSNVLLFFGFVREYKGLMYLIEALPEIHKRLSSVKLLVVGDFYDDKHRYEEKIAELGLGDLVDIHDGYIPDKEVGVYFSAADLVVLPYASATQSGIVQIAYGFNKPVVATAVGGLPEVVEDGKTGFIVPPKDKDALAAAIVRFFVEDKGAEFALAIAKCQDKFSWRRMVQTIESFVQVNG